MIFCKQAWCVFHSNKISQISKCFWQMIYKLKTQQILIESLIDVLFNPEQNQVDD